MGMSKEQTRQMVSLKQHFPFRIVFGAMNPETGEFETRAVVTKRPMNDFLRKGWLVWQV